MSANDVVLILTALAGIVSVLVSLVTATSAAKKDAVTTLEKLVDKLQKQVDNLTAENQTLRNDLDEVRDENSDLRAWAEELVKQVEGLGHKPVPFRPRKRD